MMRDNEVARTGVWMILYSMSNAAVTIQLHWNGFIMWGNTFTLAQIGPLPHWIRLCPNMPTMMRPVDGADMYLSVNFDGPGSAGYAIVVDGGNPGGNEVVGGHTIRYPVNPEYYLQRVVQWAPYGVPTLHLRNNDIPPAHEFTRSISFNAIVRNVQTGATRRLMSSLAAGQQMQVTDMQGELEIVIESADFVVTWFDAMQVDSLSPRLEYLNR